MDKYIKLDDAIRTAIQAVCAFNISREGVGITQFDAVDVADRMKMIPTADVADVLDLINRQKAEIERLETELKAMRGAANSYKAEVERLSSDRYLLKEDGTMTLLPRMDVTKIKAEAIKEFRGRLWKKLCTRVTPSFVFDFIRFVEEEMEKEMKEEMVGES